VAFGEAVAAEPLDLLVAAAGEVLVVPARGHAADHLRLELVHRADVAEGRHRAAQQIGFGRREIGSNDRKLHRLFLKQRDAERLAEHTA